MDELVEQFPTRDTRAELDYRSFIFQPDRVSVNSRISLLNPQSLFANAQLENYYQFTNELRSPLLRIKQMELLRATIPNAVTSIPISQGVFFYRRLPADPIDDFGPDYSEFYTEETIHMVRLLPQGAYNPDLFTNPSIYGYNATFGSYEDLITELNKSTLNDPDFDYDEWEPNTAYPKESFVIYQDKLYFAPFGSLGTAVFNTDTAWILSPIRPFIPGDITFTYNATLNKVVITGNNSFDEDTGKPAYYYLPVGYADVFLPDFISEITSGLFITRTQFPTNLPYTLNRRLGFLWASIAAELDLEDEDVTDDINAHLFPKPTWNDTTDEYEPLLPNYTAEGYTDLVHTQNVFVYCDFVGGSTQDTNLDERLLAVVPMNASNLGITFGESKIVCPLTKVSGSIYQMRFTLRTDTGEPFLLPINAYVNLEIKLEY
jgi:hypothetical protein